MCFRQALRNAVVFCAPACSTFDRQTPSVQPAPQFPASRIDRRSIFERELGFGLDLRMTEFGRGPVALHLIAAAAGQGQIAYAAAATPGTWNDMLNFQGHIFCPAVSAFADPLLKQVFPDLVTHQLSLLVLNPGYFRVFQRLSIKLDQFQGEGRYRCRPDQASAPCLDIGKAASQTRRQPTFPPAAVIKPGGAVAGMARPTTAANCPS